MKKYIFSAIRLTFVMLILCVGIYTLIIYGFAQFSNNHGEGEVVKFNGKDMYVNIGQKFTDDKYFNSRPSAVAYNAAGSGASNKAFSNPDYLKEVNARVDSFLVHNPGIKKSDIPVDLITASGSGLDPNISVDAALIQIKRIARIRNKPEIRLVQLVNEKIEAPLFGIIGTKKVNVLLLNIALDKLN
jgi:K+-transporting ATPase ATPase C chain